MPEDKLKRDRATGEWVHPADEYEWEKPWMGPFLRRLLETGNVQGSIDDAAEEAGSGSQSAVYRMRVSHKQFAAAMRRCEMGAARRAAHERGVIGWRAEETTVEVEQVTVDGVGEEGFVKIPAEVRRTRTKRTWKYDNRLLVRYLEAYDPDWNRSRGAALAGGTVEEQAAAVRGAVEAMLGAVPLEGPAPPTRPAAPPPSGPPSRNARHPGEVPHLCEECGARSKPGSRACPNPGCQSRKSSGPPAPPPSAG